MKPLRERNQVVVGAVALVVIVGGVFAAFRAQDLPWLSGGTEYTAEFTDSAGLRPGNVVEVAGIRVGQVTDVELNRGKVDVSFRMSGISVGDQTRAAIEIKTLLGDKFLSVQPAGSRPQPDDVPIPVSRTTTPFDIPAAFGGLSDTVQQIDTAQLAQSFTVLSQTFADTPGKVRGTLVGLSRLSASIASRDRELTELLHSAANVSGVLDQRRQQVRRLVDDGGTLLAEVQRRKDAIDQLLSGTRRLADELRGLVHDNQHTLGPALKELDDVTGLLERNRDALGRAVASMTLYGRLYNNTIGNGRWFDGHLCGLITPTISAGAIQINPTTCGPPQSAEDFAAKPGGTR